MPNDLDNFTRGYLEAALWASTDDVSNPLDARYSLDDFNPETKTTARDLCERFMSENESALDLYCERVAIVDDDSPMAYAGHDLWLTRIGSGTGFWDRDMDKVITEPLSESARKLGEANVWEDAGALLIDGMAEFELREISTRIAAVRELDTEIAATQVDDAIERRRAERLLPATRKGE